MNQNVYGFPASTSNFVQTSHGGYDRPGVTTNANMSMDYPQAQQQAPPQVDARAAWGYQQVAPVVNAAGSQIQPQPNVNPSHMQAPIQYANVPNVEKPWTGNDPVQAPNSQRNFPGGVVMEENFAEGFNETELFQGQPVLRQVNQGQGMSVKNATSNPKQNAAPLMAPGKEASGGNGPVQTRYSNAPTLASSKVEAADDDVDDDEEEEDAEEGDDDPSKDPWFEPDEEEEDEFIPDMSASDEDFTIGRKRKPRKTKGAKRVTRSQSLTSKKGGTRSGRKKNRSQDDDYDDDSDDDYVTVPIRRGQPALSRNDSSDDEYLPAGKRAKITPKKVPAKRGRTRTKSTPLTSKGGLKYEVYSDSPDDVSDSDEEEIMLHRGQPVTNTRRSSKCADDKKKTPGMLAEQNQIVFLVNLNMQERIKQLPADCLYSDDNYIWRLQNNVLVKFKQRGDSNYFQATSNYLNYLPEMEKNYVAVSVEYLKDAGMDIVRLFDVPEITSSGPAKSATSAASYIDQPTTTPKKRRGRPPKISKSNSDSKPVEPSPGRKRGRPKKPKTPSVTEPPEPDFTTNNGAKDDLEDIKKKEFLQEVVNHYMNAGEGQLPAANSTAISKFEEQVAALKSRILDLQSVCPAFAIALQNHDQVTVEANDGEKVCQNSHDNSQASKVFCFQTPGQEDKKRFFVSESVAKRAQLWHKLHHFPQKLKYQCNNLKPRNNIGDQDEPAANAVQPNCDHPQSDVKVTSSERAVQNLITDIIKKVESKDMSGESPVDEGRKTEMLEELSEIVRSACDIIESHATVVVRQ